MLTNSNRNRVVLITGARTGIGREIGVVFARNGYRVVFSGRSIGDCSTTVKKLVAEGCQVSEVPIDLSDIANLEANVNRAIEVWGGLDILINNAAIIDPIARLKQIRAPELENSTIINFVAPTMLIKYCWEHLKTKKGKVLNVLSGAATNAIEGWTAYCSTKAALHMINQQTHVEGKRDYIKSIGISPGMVDTKMQGQIRQSGVNQVSKVKKEDLISCEVPAKFTLWCASEEANEFSGKMISLSDPDIHKRYVDWSENNIHK